MSYAKTVEEEESFHAFWVYIRSFSTVHIQIQETTTSCDIYYLSHMTFALWLSSEETIVVWVQISLLTLRNLTCGRELKRVEGRELGSVGSKSTSQTT